MVQTADMGGCLGLGGRRVPSCLGRPCGGLRTIELFDITGRLARRENNVTERLYHCSIAGLAMGPYWVRVTDGTKYKVKKLIVH